MSSIRTLSGKNDSGFDPNRSLLVLAPRKTSTLYLVDNTVLGLFVKVEDETIATVNERDETTAHAKDKRFTAEERGEAIARLDIKGLKTGETKLRFTYSSGADGAPPVTVRVIDNADLRQSGDKGLVTSGFREELQKLTLREAVLRVAEDQMYSNIGRNVGGFGRYAEVSYDWCGAFAWYCWNTACAAKGVPNPFGSRYNSLLSCQKAISYAMQTGSSVILRYEGGDPFGNSFTTGKALSRSDLKRQSYIEIGGANPLEPADIAILRTGSESGWKHVAMVWETPTDDDLKTIDGNQGNPCIQKRTRSMKAKAGNGYALVFLHVLI